ncbi:MAG: conjugal transfer protein TraD [Alphaproteobacteria bacterium]|nr:conjugal transfer protein TraD [Alphaproteobacteria bacterium]
MKNQRNAERQSRTRLLIQIGGLVQKAKILEAFNINVGDDLQDYESLNKAARLLGFLCNSLEQLDESEASLAELERNGERLLRYG